MTDTFRIAGKVAKVSESLGLVLGYAIVCTEDGEPYYDLQGDHIPEDAMLKAALDFAEHSQVAGDTHTRDATGNVVKHGTVPFLFPLTADIAKALDIETPTTGLLVALRPNDEMLTKFKSGEYTGFSIGGERIRDEAVSGE